MAPRCRVYYTVSAMQTSIVLLQWIRTTCFVHHGSSALLVLLGDLRANVQEETDGSTMATGAKAPPTR
jgi:hypothetical protein